MRPETAGFEALWRKRDALITAWDLTVLIRAIYGCGAMLAIVPGLRRSSLALECVTAGRENHDILAATYL
jgi:hypothetical protein